MSLKQLPPHCSDCTWLFSKMGACPHPEVSIFFSYMSFLPYLIIFYLVGLTVLKRRVSLIRLTSMLVVAYIIGDKMLKNVFQSSRPQFSCKTTFGMPSSHMTVIVAVTVYMLIKKDLNVLVKLGMIALCIIQGIARINLHYHTYQQVFGGTIFGMLFAIVYFKLFDLVYPKITHLIPSFLNIRDNFYEYTPIQEK